MNRRKLSAVRGTISGLLALAGMATCLTAAESAKPADKAAITFNKHVAPIVFARCAACHRPGEVAPFSLLTYRDVSKRAEQIVDVTGQRIMPPWKPLAGHGEFANGRSLSADEIELIGRWAAGGAVEGAAADLPPQPTFAAGWQLGTPDVVVTMPQPMKVPAEGRDVYQNILLSLKVPDGKYIKAAEYRPANRRIVHHSVLYYDTSGKARQRDEADPELGFAAVTPPGKLLPGPMSIWAPGRLPMPLPTDLSMPWPAAADLILQLHLHPSGKPEEEQSSIGFYFTDEPPRRSMLDVALIDTKIDIAPGEKVFRTEDRCLLPIDMEAVSIFPHMHMIGRQIKVTAKLPDGTLRPLVQIDDWDFNWQDIYQYAEPVRLPQGTELVLEGTHDNSADNPHNPRNPPQRVRWGEQTFNEMSIAFLNLLPVRESDVPTLKSNGAHRIQMAIVPESTKAAVAAAPAAKPASAEDLAQRTKEALRHIDRDHNGKVSLEEILVVVGERRPKAEIEKGFHQFDRDGDQQLDVAELGEAIKALTKR